MTNDLLDGVFEEDKMLSILGEDNDFFSSEKLKAGIDPVKLAKCDNCDKCNGCT